MSSNSGQNQSQSSDQSYRQNRRHYNDGNGSSGRQYFNSYPNRFENQVNYYYNNGYSPYPQWSEPQNYGYFNQQTFDSNDRHLPNYSQNYHNFNPNEMPNNLQSFRNNNESNKVMSSHQRRPQQRYQRPQYNRNQRPNPPFNDITIPSNDLQLENQTTGESSRNLEEGLQNPSNGNITERKRDNKDSNRDNQRDKQNNRKERYDKRYERDGHQRHNDRTVERTVERRVDRNDTNSQNYSNRFERTERNVRDVRDRDVRDGHQRSNHKKVEKRSEKTATTSSDNNRSDRKTTETNKRRIKPKEVPECDETQREIMEELLRKGEFECMVCCDLIRIKDTVWCCEHCFNVFHLKCTQKWANSQTAKSERGSPQSQSWRCPTCQTNHFKIPSTYYCFCGKMREPELNRYLVPHSCGETCGRKTKSDATRKYNCPHKCLLRCHPGSCPPCEMKVSRECGCGKTQKTVNCMANDVDIVCDKVCNKMLSCGQHFCQLVCHSGKCGDCSVTKTQNCFCGQNQRQVECNLENNLIDNYCCDHKCDKSLKCGNHRCDRICHFDDCNDCPLIPESVTNCCCGKTPITDLTKTKRKSCLDAVPTCNQICDKELICGPDKDKHRCLRKCHSGPCPPCDQKTVIRCRCGANNQNIDCIELTQNDRKTFICKKRCNKKRMCGRHKCLNECCIDVEHRCQQICGKKLSCGQHSCEELCHSGSCPQCWNISWDELTCRCGAEIKIPPIGCGSKRPECNRMCSRWHSCDHPIDHLCHDDEYCPPCTYFTPKVCFGGHETRPVPCYETSFSCGYLCQKSLDCGLHNCQMLCHSVDCNECTNPCNKIRTDCEHKCGLKCHQKTSPDVCPKSICKVMVKVFCDCGRKSDVMPCFKVNDENALRISLNSLANQRLKNGESVDVTLIMKNIKDFKHIQLKCDDLCAHVERNRQLAEALDVRDADFNPEPGPPRYSDLLKNSAKTDPTFVKEIYEKLSKLVMESKQSKLSFKNLNFPPMNSENRHIIHDLAEHFGLKTHAVDREPNRSVVVKAVKDKCYLPTLSLIDFVKEESESRKSNKITLKSHCFDNGSDATNLKSIASGLTGLSLIRSTSSEPNPTPKNNGPIIDYFDFKGE